MPAAGVPLSTRAVARVERHAARQRAPCVTDGVGVPVAVTVKVPAVPTVNVAPAALVIAGAWFTVSVKVCVASGATPLPAVSVRS